MDRETKTFPSLLVASTATGIALIPTSFSLIQECAEWLCGYPVWTHELADRNIMKDATDEAFRQFPSLPTKSCAERDFTAARDHVVDTYGNTLEVIRGAATRHIGPLATLSSLAPNTPTIVVDVQRDAPKVGA